MGQSTIGQMVNLLSNDVNRFDMTPFFLHYLWCGPLQFMMVMYLTWDKIGASTFIGGALIIAFVPLQSKSFFSTIALLPLMCNSSVFRLDWKSVFKAQKRNCQENRRKDPTDERNYTRHPSDQDVCLGEQLCQARSRSQKGRN